MTLRERYNFKKIQNQTIWHENCSFNSILPKLFKILFYSPYLQNEKKNIYIYILRECFVSHFSKPY